MMQPTNSVSGTGLISATLVFLLSAVAGAHPVPDLPIRSYFESGGKLEIRVEVDPRCFADDPEQVDYMTREAAEGLSEEDVRELHEKADLFISQRLRFLFKPVGELKPEFVWKFANLGDGSKPLEDGDPSILEGNETVLVGSWKTNIVSGMAGYQVAALEVKEGKMGIPLNVPFLNYIDGKQQERYMVMFPGEESFVFDISGVAAGADATEPDPDAVGMEADAGDWWAVFWTEAKRGFDHVIPKGLDHILFVLGLFLMSRKWKPLLLQVTAFTVAHTLTLWLASAGIVNLPGSVVEPIIAASIVVIAVENILHRRYTHWRLLIVFGFGLIHGLGFAGVMSTQLDSTWSLIIGLLGVNIGVEFGQLAVIGLALLATFWIAESHYRKFVVIPGSVLIAIAGVYWLIERL